MGCFSCCIDDDDDDDDLSKDDDTYKTAKLVSRYAGEDHRARQAEEDKQIALAKEESLKEIERIRSEKLKEKGKRKQEDQQLPKTDKDEGQRMNLNANVNRPPPPAASISDRRKSVIKGGKSVNPQVPCCQICKGPFAMNQIAKKGKYHLHCYKENRNLICCVCKSKLPLNEEGKREYNEHLFWKEKYCRVHDTVGTPKCCSCERLEPKGTDYVMLEDYRMLCLQCIESSVMDSNESYTLHLNIRAFFDDLGLKIEKEFLPILLVDKPALNEAETEENIDPRNAAITRGLCLSEGQYVQSIKQPRIEPNNQVQSYMDMVKERIWVSGCQVAGILILYGLPRLQTGYIMVHEMMHAWLRLNGYRNLKLKLEEGLCQVLALRWLESLRFDSTDADAAASSSSHTTAKKGDPWSEFEKRLVQFCIYQIKEDESEIYGQGFKEVYKMMQSNGYNIMDTLKEIVSASNTR